VIQRTRKQEIRRSIGKKRAVARFLEDLIVAIKDEDHLVFLYRLKHCWEVARMWNWGNEDMNIEVFKPGVAGKDFTDVSFNMIFVPLYLQTFVKVTETECPQCGLPVRVTWPSFLVAVFKCDRCHMMITLPEQRRFSTKE
jgi:hypothetical protein